MTPELQFAGLILVAILSGVGVAWLNRRKTNAETMEIVDRIARKWITELNAKVTRLERRLGMETKNKRILLDHVGVLERHINDRKPPPPPPRPFLHLWPTPADDDGPASI